MENKFPDEHAALEKEVRSPCSLHVVSRENFLNWLKLQNEEGKNMKALKISLTVVVELALIYLFFIISRLVIYRDPFFLGSLAIFAIMWLVL